MITLDIPTDEQLPAAVGKLGMRHGQLDYVLRMTVKSIARLTVREGLDATSRQGSRELRELIRKLARREIGEGQDYLKVKALLERARRATNDRNALLHSLWAENEEGVKVIRDDDQQDFRPQPTVQEVEQMADRLAEIASEINDARLQGFLRDALRRAHGD